MVWFGIFLGGLVIVLIGLVKALRTRKPDMLMLNGALVAAIGFMGFDDWPAAVIAPGTPRREVGVPLFFAAGVLAALWAVYQLVWSLRALAWPSVPGTITHSASVFVGVRNSDAGAVPRSTRHAWRVNYSYNVNGKGYTGSTRALDTEEDEFDLGGANALAAAHPVGSPITVYHHPRNPGLACIHRSVVNGRWLVPELLAGLLLWVALAW